MRRSGLALAALVPAVLVLLPVGTILGQAWAAGFASLVAELWRPYALGLLRNTLVLAVSVTALTLLAGTAAAWCTERCDLPGRTAWRVVACLPLAVPAFVASYAYASLGPWFQGMGGAILILTLSSLPLVYLPVAAALSGVDGSLEDVARSLGMGPWRCFWRATLPQIRPALGGGALLVSSHMLAEFGALALLRVQTFTTAIYDQLQMQFDDSAASLLSLALLALCMPLAFAEMRMRGGRRRARVARGTGRALEPVRLGWLTLPAILLFLAIAALGLGVPVVTLGFWLHYGRSAGLGLAALLPALGGSLGFAVPGALLTTLLALPLVLLSLRNRSRLAQLADRIPYLAHGLPGIGVALALVFLSIHFAPDLYQTRLLVLLAYAVLFLPLAQSALRASAELIPPELEEAGRSLGKGPVAAFALVTLPNLAPGVAAALALLVLQLMRELTATLLLAASGVRTLATEIWSYTGELSYAAAAPFAAALVLLSGVPVYIFTVRTIGATRRR